MSDHETWYFASGQSIWPVKVIKVGKSSLTIERTFTKIGGLRDDMTAYDVTEVLGEEKVRIKSRLGEYFRSWEDAHASLLAEAEQRLKAARVNLSRAQGMHGNIVGLKKP